MRQSARFALASLVLAATPLGAAPLTTQAASLPQPTSPSYGRSGNTVAAVPVPCERVCMEDLAGRFMKALAAHDPQSLPLAGTVRYTEMGQELELGDGLWGTSSDVGGYHSGMIPALTTPEGKKIPTGFFSKPSSILISEAFKIKNGQIQQVEAVGASVPYHMHPGWGEK